jgi:hypothetical protein
MGAAPADSLSPSCVRCAAQTPVDLLWNAVAAQHRDDSPAHRSRCRPPHQTLGLIRGQPPTHRLREHTAIAQATSATGRPFLITSRTARCRCSTTLSSTSPLTSRCHLLGVADTSANRAHVTGRSFAPGTDAPPAPRQQSRTGSLTMCSPLVHSLGEEHPPMPEWSRKEPQGEQEKGSRRGTRTRNRPITRGCHPPHLAPTSNSGYSAAPTRCLKPHRLTPFRVTNHVTPTPVIVRRLFV